MLRSIFAFLPNHPNVVSAGIMLMGLGEAWAGIYVFRATRSSARGRVVVPQQWSTAERWLWLIGLMMGGLGFFLLGLTALRHSDGPYIIMSVRGPFLDQVISILSEVCILGGFVVLFAWMVVDQGLNHRARREHADEP